MRAYLRGERPLTRCLFIWGALFPILFYSLQTLIRLIDDQKERAFSAYVMENNAMFFYIQEWIAVSFGYIYLPLGVVIVSHNWQNHSSQKWGKILSRLYYVAASMLIIYTVFLIKNQRENPVQLGLKEAPIDYDTKWYLIFVFLIFTLNSYLVHKKNAKAMTIEELDPLDESEPPKS